MTVTPAHGRTGPAFDAGEIATMVVAVGTHGDGEVDARMLAAVEDVLAALTALEAAMWRAVTHDGFTAERAAAHLGIGVVAAERALDAVDALLERRAGDEVDAAALGRLVAAALPASGVAQSTRPVPRSFIAGPLLRLLTSGPRLTVALGVGAVGVVALGAAASALLGPAGPSYDPQPVSADSHAVVPVPRTAAATAPGARALTSTAGAPERRRPTTRAPRRRAADSPRRAAPALRRPAAGPAPTTRRDVPRAAPPRTRPSPPARVAAPVPATPEPARAVSVPEPVTESFDLAPQPAPAASGGSARSEGFLP